MLAAGDVERHVRNECPRRHVSIASALRLSCGVCKSSDHNTIISNKCVNVVTEPFLRGRIPKKKARKGQSNVSLQYRCKKNNNNNKTTTTTKERKKSLKTFSRRIINSNYSIRL